MKTPLHGGEWIDLVEVESTQHYAQTVLSGAVPGSRAAVITAQKQTSGKGRFDRVWYGEPGSSLMASLIFREQANHPQPWLIGMAVAVAAASALHCRVAWPNDLVSNGKKLGGILTQLMNDGHGKLIPVVGIGINLSVKEFPLEIKETATSLHQIRQGPFEAKAVLRQILDRIETLPDINSWDDLRPVWTLFDSTAGKNYRLANGDLAIGIGIGPKGELICAVEGETQSVLAADAIFGSEGPSAT